MHHSAEKRLLGHGMTDHDPDTGRFVTDGQTAREAQRSFSQGVGDVIAQKDYPKEHNAVTEALRNPTSATRHHERKVKPKPQTNGARSWDLYRNRNK